MNKSDVMGIYTMEQLIPVVAGLAEEFTSKESCSVTYEKARQLMEAVIYCIGHLDSCNSLLVPNVEVKESKQTNIPIQTVSEVDKSFNNDSEEDYVIEETPLFINDSINDNPSEKEQVTMDFKVNEKNEQIKKIEFYPCGLVMGTYIIAQNDDAMYLIDQHAAQERINYEKIRNALYDDKIKTTDLLIPISIELSPSDYLKFQDNKKVLTDLGFVIDDFGINTIIIKTHPTWLISGYEEENIRRIIDYILEMPKDFDRVRFIDNISATCACKMSVKGNTSITMEEAESILNQLVKCDNPYNCPHGRPTIITFTKYELERLFKRVMN